jgi:E3 ubiquitin-protein ligase UBR2
MDKVVRQVGQHIEFDPEWETAFNLVIKIQTILFSILEWCANDVSPRRNDVISMDYEILL